MSSISNPSPLSTSSLEEWRQEFLNSYSSVADLIKNRLVSSQEAVQLNSLGERFKVRITPYYANLMEPRVDCPIRLQAIPHLGEEDPVLPQSFQDISQRIYQRSSPWHGDAIGDVKNLAVPRLTHRYENRAILHLSSICAVYCRFCFRKSHLNDDEKTLYEGSLDEAIEYIGSHTEIRELILTGGDPLSSTDSVIRRLFERVSSIEHIRMLRIHSRMAVTLPSRFTPALLDLFRKDWNFSLTLVSHFNHPQEITYEARTALKNLRKTGITLLNQSVLLKGVNSDFECLKTLFQTLYENGVIPFYLHHPDWTPGTFHFRISIDEGRKLYAQLKGHLSGPALPHYILDIPQGYGKIALSDPSLAKKIQSLVPDSLHSNSKIGGAIYELTPPTIRKPQNQPILYLDLYPC
jgi:lysine 2,3-aminomutase